MTFLLLLPAALSALVLAAHFLRMGNPVLTLYALAVVALLFARRRWAARVVQVGLLLGALEWLRAMTTMLGERRSLGLPYARMVVILGSVAAVAALAALLFQTPRLRRRYPPAPSPAPAPGARADGPAAPASGA